MITLAVKADGLLNLADEIEEGAKPQLLELMDGATDLFYDDVERRLSVKGAPIEGDAPHEIKGELKRAVKKSKSHIKGKDIIGGLYTAHPGAALLEYGGIVLGRVAKIAASRSRMKADLKAAGQTGRKAHPAFRPSMLAMETKIQQFFEGAFK